MSNTVNAVDCQRCGTEDALNVEAVRVYESTEYDTLNLCEFCRSIPSGIMRHGDGHAYAIVGNILARLIKEISTKGDV